MRFYSFFLLAPPYLLARAYENFIVGGENAIANEWIVVMKESKSDVGVFSPQVAETLANEVAEKTKSKKMKLLGIYTSAIEGFSVSGMTETAAREFINDKRVAYVEQNGKVTANAIIWGLDRIDQRELPLDDGNFSPAGNYDGTGITAYIIDTGIRITHNEFSGRAKWGVNTAEDGKDTDCNGHGTHVAGTVGGITYGVAKNVDLVAVKVIGCSGVGSYDTVIGGINWVITDAVGKTATANLSLGGPTSSTVDTAVRNLHDSGVVTIVAAGNNATDACNESPAREPAVVTVASSTITDEQSSFSNFGECVDIFAPGSDILSAWYDSDSALRTISGTSMASPLVCGAAALLLQSGIDAASVDDEIVTHGTVGLLTDVGGSSPNLLLYVGEIVPTNHPTPAPPTPAPTPCTEAIVIIEVTTDQYPRETAWTLFNECDNVEQLSRSPLSYEEDHTKFIDEDCIPFAKYTFEITDTYDDGICCEYGDGKYKVTYDGVVKKSGSGDYGTSESTTFGSCDTRLGMCLRR